MPVIPEDYKQMLSNVRIFWKNMSTGGKKGRRNRKILSKEIITNIQCNPKGLGCLQYALQDM